MTDNRIRSGDEMANDDAFAEMSREPFALLSRKPVDLLRDRCGVYGVGIVEVADRRVLQIAGEGLPTLILRPDALAENANGVAALQRSTGGFRRGPFMRSIEERLRSVIHHRMLHTAGLPWPPQHRVSWWSTDKERQARNRQIYHGLRCGSLGIVNKLIGAAIEEAANPDAIKMARRFTFRLRYDIYCATARSTRALQLAETFPVLARAIYCSLGDKRFDAIRLVERGARLRDVAALMDMSMAWRRVKPGAAHLAPRGIDAQLLAYMPDSLPRMKLWLLAVAWAGVNYGADFAKWVARNAARVPGRGVERHCSFLSDIADWVKACREADILIVRPFSPDMALRTVTKLSADWHEAIARDLDGPQYSFPEPWLPATELNGREIIPITNAAELYREGAAMRHCARTYADDVMAGRCYMYSVREEGKRVATVEIVRAGNRARWRRSGDHVTPKPRRRSSQQCGDGSAPHRRPPISRLPGPRHDPRPF
jgi:PcfJ-like protein